MKNGAGHCCEDHLADQFGNCVLPVAPPVDDGMRSPEHCKADHTRGRSVLSASTAWQSALAAARNVAHQNKGLAFLDLSGAIWRFKW